MGLFSKMMDDYDIKILSELQKNGRISNKDLALATALSSTPCWRRVKSLEEAVVIDRYVALLDPKKIGLSIMAFAYISLEHHAQEEVEKFEQMIIQSSEVLESYQMSGEYDYMLKIVVADMDSYERFINRTILRNPIVRSTNTSFAMKTKKQTTELSLEHIQQTND
jgi:DNA-binding Lrp family transcriptional regulator